MSMVEMRGCRALIVGVAGVALSGCVAAVPVAPSYTVIPGQGKTEANLRADDAACRGGAAPVATSGSQTASSAAPSRPASAVTADQYYQCMASRGEAVIQAQPQAYPAYAYAAPAYAYAAPAYAPYAYPAVAAYPYPYYAYGYGYPYDVGYFGPYVGFGIGFGYGGFHGDRGFYRSGFGGGFHDGGFHGGYAGGRR